MEQNYNEAPASWNVRYRTPDGYESMLTLRGDNGVELLSKAEAALNWLKDHGCAPTTNGYGHKAARSPAETENTGPGDPSWCDNHKAQMKRYEKNGRAWYSHKTDDGNWCNGRRK
ncbi:MAG: hypothetical protein M1370_07435 [Bacteroidetes bacterium]|nr:hypothetical protein [Bacteroidota bacterium]